MDINEIDSMPEGYPMNDDDLLLICIAYPDLKEAHGNILNGDEVLKRPEVQEYIREMNRWVDLFKRVEPRNEKLDSELFNELQLLLKHYFIYDNLKKSPKESKAKMFIVACRDSYRKQHGYNARTFNELLDYAMNNQINGYSPITQEGHKYHWLGDSATKKALLKWFREV